MSASKFPTTIGAEVKDFDPKPYFKNAKTVKSIDRFAHLAVAASKMAIEDSGFDTGSLDAAGFAAAEEELLKEALLMAQVRQLLPLRPAG